jgi:hypothetical protein
MSSRPLDGGNIRRVKNVSAVRLPGESLRTGKGTDEARDAIRDSNAVETTGL